MRVGLQIELRQIPFAGQRDKPMLMGLQQLHRGA